jgi:hypothetical protein
LMHQRERVRRHLQGALRRNGLHYRAETGHKSHWTIQHYSWLRARPWISAVFSATTTSFC